MGSAPTVPTLRWAWGSEWSWAEGGCQMVRGAWLLPLAKPGRHPSSLPACGLGSMAVFPELSRPGTPSLGLGVGVGLRTLERAPGGGATCGFSPLLLASVLRLNGAAGP